jgi:hypothetical protein
MSVAEASITEIEARATSKSAPLNCTVHPVSSLSPGEREEMWALYSRFYLGTRRERFRADLAEKDTALILRDADGCLQGFSTLATWSREFAGAPIRVLFSGDTIIEREHWGSQALAFNWLRHAGGLKRMQPEVPLYWFLIVKGQRTFRFLPTFALEFLPDWRTSPAPGASQLLTLLAREKFGDAYDPATGVIRFRESHGHLAQQWAKVSEREAAREDVQFFLRRNPGYVRGDELACLCELSSGNLRPLARRVFNGAADA